MRDLAVPASAALADAHTPLIQRCWYIAGLLDEFTEALQERYLLGHSVLIYRASNGEPIALQNRCAHRAFPLSHGRREGDDVVCMYHGLRYSPQGQCVHAPMLRRAAPHVSIRRYPSAVRGPLVWIWMGDPAEADEADIPDTRWLESAAWAHRNGYVQMPANYIGLYENLLDLTHFSYLHAGNIGTPAWAEAPCEVTVIGQTVQLVRRLALSPPPGIFINAMDLDPHRPVNREIRSEWKSPAMFCAEGSIEVPSEGPHPARLHRFRFLHLITPETQHSLHNWAFIGHDFAIDDPRIGASMLADSLKAFQEDREALQWIHELEVREGWPAVRQASFASDRGGLEMRRIVRRLADAEAPSVQAAA